MSGIIRSVRCRPSTSLRRLWGGQAGSLLFWTLILSDLQRDGGGDAIAGSMQTLMPYVNAVMHGSATFFLTLLVFAANPFKQVGFVPPDGRG